MSNGEKGESGRQHLHIALPVLLVDEVLPLLKDTELRVLLVVLRQTHVKGKETGRCWLTHGELCRRTGRASEAVSGAVERLVEKHLLHVMDESGQALHTTADRQQMRGQHFYRVSYFDTLEERSAQREQAHSAGKPKTIEMLNKPYSFRKPDLNPIASSSLETEQSVLPADREKIELQKKAIRQRLRQWSK